MAKSNSKSAFIATIIVAVIAAIVAGFAIWKVIQREEKESALNEDKSENYLASDELLNEMKTSASMLIKDNYIVLKMFYTRGLNYKEEPYGNIPEDGLLTVTDEEYTTMSQLEELVNSTYTKETAKKILTDPSGKGAVYATREDEEVLGINYEFSPIEYDTNWDNPTFIVTAKSEIQCEVKVTVHDKDGGEVILEGTMLKLNGLWVLKEVIM